MGTLIEDGSITNDILSSVNSGKFIEYYERMWSNHYKGVMRDHDAAEHDRELIDFFVLPAITSTDEEIVTSPFYNACSTNFVVAGSGFGKTTLMHILLLCCLIDKQIIDDCSVIKDGINGKEKRYSDVKESLFGKSSFTCFPVFIDSNKANSQVYSSVLELAEGSDIDCFFEMVKCAYDNSSLLLLIDSIDEVKSSKLSKYLASIEKLLSEYRDARIVLTSRFSGNIKLPFNYNLLHLKELNDDDIIHITHAILSEEKAEQFLSTLKNNRFIKSLVKNPFALMTFLENRKDHILHHMIGSMVNAIIELRWKKHANHIISLEDTKLLLGFLACSYIFGNKMHASMPNIRQYFNKIKNNFKLSGVPYEIPSGDVTSFLNALSSQSGILNIEVNDHIEEYVFQDDLVACWLAANYINSMINETSEISERDGNHTIWSNMCWLDDFIRSFEIRDNTLSDLGIYTISMALTMCSENNGQELQMMFLSYLICRDATSTDPSEQERIANGYKILIGNYFGENDLTNKQSGEAMKIINRMLLAHTDGTSSN